MLRIDNLSYSYRRGVKALDSVSGTLPKGFTLLLGQNGAGKTTLLRLLSGMLYPQEGIIDFEGEEPRRRTPQFLSRVFFVPDDYQLPLPSIRNLAGAHAPFYPTFDSAMLDDNLQRFGLTGHERYKNLSLGNKHKSMIAYALSLRTPFLLFDEPANGLDIAARHQMRQMMSACVSEEQTVIVATHSIADLENLYENLMVLRRGHMPVCMSLESIMEKLAFVEGYESAPDALFALADGARVRSIVPAGDCPTAIDYEVLYTALMSDRCQEIVKQLNTI